MTNSWAAGAYPLMAERLEPVAARAVAAADVAPGSSVLDVACGTGNAAIVAAEAGAGRVVGVDWAPELLAVAESRTRTLGLETISWRAGDVEETGAADGEFDVVLSVFGSMYAPSAEGAARELVRVCRPGGTIVSAAWTPDGFMAQTNGVLARYLPPPPAGGGPPTRWGDEAFVRGLFGGGAAVVEAHIEALPFDFAGAGDAASFWIATAGHVQLERDRLEHEGRWDALHADLAELFASAGTPAAGGALRVESEYLLAVMHPPAS